jgi:type I restriction enzyme S subunit
MPTLQRRKRATVDGELPQGWRRVKLSDILEFKNGINFTADQKGEDGILTLDVRNMYSAGICADLDKLYRVKISPREEYALKRGDLLFVRSSVKREGVGWTSMFREHNEPVTFCGFIIRGRLRKSEASSEFLTYYLRSQPAREVIVSSSSQVTITNINQGALGCVEVPLPSLDEQERIVAEIEKQFTRLEAGVSSLTHVQAALKRYLASVLKAACEGRLVPTEAELARKENRSYESADVLLQRILKERRQSWNGRGKYKEPVPPNIAALPELPTGWCWAGTEQLTVGIDNALTIGPFGSNLMVKDYREAGVPLIFVREIRSENFKRSDTRYVSREKAEELATHKVRGGDVVITKMGEPPGDTAIYPERLPDAIATSDCIKLSPNVSATSPAFLKYIIRAQPVKNQIERITRGVAQKKMSLARFKTVAIPLPPIAEQQRIVADVERRLSLAEEPKTAVAVNLQRSTRLRQSILQKAFTGEL